MKIIRNNQWGTFTLVPVEVDEEQIIVSVLGILKPGDKLSYGGRGKDSDGSVFIHLHAGGHKESRISTTGNINIIYSVYVDSIEIILRGTSQEDKKEVSLVRDICYWGSHGLVFINDAEVNGKKAIVVTGMRCKQCGMPMINLVACEWKICNVCADKCEHNYILGAVHGGGINIGVGKFCRRCGRSEPKVDGERELSMIEHHLAVEKELGIKIMYKDGPPNTPRQLVFTKRIQRGYNKSRKRNK